MNIRLTPEDILAFYQKYGKLPDTHLFAPEDLKEFFTLLHLTNAESTLNAKSKNAIWEKTRTSLQLPATHAFSWANTFKILLTTLAAGTAVFAVFTHFSQTPMDQNTPPEIAFEMSNQEIDNLLADWIPALLMIHSRQKIVIHLRAISTAPMDHRQKLHHSLKG